MAQRLWGCLQGKLGEYQVEVSAPDKEGGRMKRILVTGGAGYLGSILVPKLLEMGNEVTVVDTCWFGNHLPDHAHLRMYKGDIRDRKLIDEVLDNCDQVIHLACLSNDPMSDIDPELTKQINYDASLYLIKKAYEKKIERFIFASSSSVYGLKEEPEVTEDLPLEPISLYSELKARVEEELRSIDDDDFVSTYVRSATICGWSPRFRMDLLVNALTVSCLERGVIEVHGGNQVRANIHIRDVADFYIKLLDADRRTINRQAFNINDENSTVMAMAERIAAKFGCEITIAKLRDPRSYSLCDRKARRLLGFANRYSIDVAIEEIADAYNKGRIRTMDPNYYNIKKLMMYDLDSLFWR